MKKTTRILFTTWLVLSGIAGSPTPCVADAFVSVNPDIEITRPTVRLSDLFAGVPAEIDRDIAQAPPACRPAIYDSTVLKKLGERYRLEWLEQNSPDHVTVSSPCTRITSDMVRAAVIEKLKANGDLKNQNFDVVLDRRNLEVDLPAKDNPNFELQEFSFDPSNKQFRTSFTAETPQGPYVLPITGRVALKRNVPVLAHRLEGGSIVSAADVEWVEMPQERVSADVVTEASQLVGREIRHDLQEGAIVRSHDIMPARLVQRGALVTMKIETPYILITAQGKAQDDGAEGDTIRVINTQSNRIIEGTVTGLDIVEIRIPQKIASVE